MTSNPSSEPPTNEDWGEAVKAVSAIMEMIVGTASLREATGAYRDRLVEDQGFSGEDASSMAVEFHRLAMSVSIEKTLASIRASGRKPGPR